MNLDSDSPNYTLFEERAIDSQSEQLSLEKVEVLARAIVERQLEDLTVSINHARWTLEALTALQQSTQKRMPLSMQQELVLLQRELNSIARMLPAENAVSLSSMLASDESYSAPYTGPGSARPFSGKLG